MSAKKTNDVGPPDIFRTPTDLLADSDKIEVPAVRAWKGFSSMPELFSPRRFEALTRKSQDITEMEHTCFAGLQVNVQNILHKNFTVGHTLHWGKRENENPFTGEKDGEHSLYAFTSGLKTGGWLLNGRWATNGLTNAVAQYSRGGLTLTVSGQLSEDERRTMVEGDVAYSRKDYCVQAKLQGPAVGLSYAQAVTRKLSAGVEFVYSINQESRIKYVGRHHDKDLASTSTLSYTTEKMAEQVSLNYSKKVRKGLNFMSEIDLSYSKRQKQWGSVLKAGYAYQSDTAMIRGLVESTGKVMCMVEEPMNDMMSMTVSAKVDFPKNVYDFGFGINANI